ncbi:MAG: FKBP-type peptidyl-prolyl cis-trans isomerase [Propionibacteriaceae bacterium]|nr:FKBP-type peptidyl-prolyl cis-trans isomerase [Propionibacteriaceae bacterium]
MTRKRLSWILGSLLVVGMTATMASCSSPSDSTSPSASPTATDGSTIESTATPTDSATDLPSAPDITNPPPSSTMDGVSATGGIGDSPDLTVPWPWTISSTQTLVMITGTGATVPSDGWVQVNYYGENARTGDVFDESYSSGTPANFPLQGVIPGFQKGLAGQKVGTRLIIAIPGADGYDAQGGQTDANIQIGDTLVFVVDILRTSYDEPTGTDQTVTDATLPTVSGDLSAPTVTIPSGTAPTNLVVQPLITGPDASVAVQAGDVVVVNYAEYVWSSGTMIRQTYGFSPLTGALSSTLPGWQQALVGQPLGSRLLLVVPPALSYPQGYPKLGIPSGSTMVYVIDVLYSYSSGS